MWDRTAEPSPAAPARRRNPDLQRPSSEGVWSSSLSNPGRRPADPCNRVVLSYSRRIFLRFFLDARMESFLAGHVEAFEAWAGVPRVLLYDNLKSAVLERRDDAIRFNPTLIAFAAHYRYEPRPVAVARGNEKGRVERSIRYIRDSFFAARRFKNLDDLNAQADAWCGGVASDRLCPGSDITVCEAFTREAASETARTS